jgi:hypothetical protein
VGARDQVGTGRLQPESGRAEGEYEGRERRKEKDGEKKDIQGGEADEEYLINGPAYGLP